ncbi:Isoleucine--tRNA ligase mitochondrial [Ceratocystis platani]|uniref:Isoleucine--tRNA ligase, mitochondrial n=1 Tax=Ceratocystis fimbriata f. sp. platani TaxID=88771 RepID=A0A0F8B5Q9_CERFI|nr:Isoleucine--tRNA ligase mitochondrial [Ceratocystis platani]
MSKSWSSTLRLPRSSIPPRPLPAQRDQLIRATSDELYKWQASNRQGSDNFVIHDGPPYANGNLHVGHALNKVLKDMILRVKIQQGRRVTYRPGWDCHGLPIELKALEALGKSAKDLTPAQIRKAARGLASKTIVKQMKEFQSIGIMSDWDGRWTTMDAAFEISQLRLFQHMVRRGLIYRRHKPVYWSPSSGTALAEAELEYRNDHISTAAYVKFPIAGPQLAQGLGLPTDEPLHAVIWTTTPWTLPANRAIAVHNDIGYSVVKVNGEMLLVAGSRLEAVASWFPEGTEIQTVLENITGSQIAGASYSHKLRGQTAETQPIIHAPFVTADSGTGLVHLAPGHGMEDYEACLELGIDVAAPINDAGFFTKDAYPEDPGVLTSAPSILDGGSQAVLDLMGSDILYTHKLKHKYPYDWRTKRPVVVRATAQWFADVRSLKEDALQSLRDVAFVPASGRSRLESFINGRSEWCISRQRAWGVPIPALYDEAGEAIVTDESISHIINTIKDRGIDAWFSDSPDEEAWIEPSLYASGKKFKRGTDTMDVWFDSGSSWSQTPTRADIYLEGSDQHRGWFQSSLLSRIAAAQANNEKKPEAPFHTLITHGFTLDTSSQKMSKSLGNILSPAQVMDGSLLPPVKLKGKARTAANGPVYENLGPDALRLWVASSEYTKDISIGELVLKAVHASLNKYRVILRMLAGSLHQSARTAPLTTIDRIALTQLFEIMKVVGSAFDKHEFFRGVSALNHWISVDLSAFYLEALKDRLYCGDGGGVIEPIFNGLLRMLAPITPLLVEETWQHRPQWLKDLDPQAVSPAKQLYNAPLIDTGRLHGLDDAELARDIPLLMATSSAVKAALEKARLAKVLGSSLQSAVVISVKNSHIAAQLRKYAGELDAMFVVSSVDVVTDTVELVVANGQWYYTHDFEVQGIPMRAIILPPKMHKCARCWRFLAEMEEGLCGRCEEVVKTVT